MGFTDRIKLRPLVSGEHENRLYISSEEAAIRMMEPDVEKITMPRAGSPVIGRASCMSIGTVPMKFRVSIDRDQCMAMWPLRRKLFLWGIPEEEGARSRVNPRHCVACHRCLAMCPRDAISIEERPIDYRSHPLWTTEIKEAILQPGKDRENYSCRDGKCPAVPGHLRPPGPRCLPGHEPEYRPAPRTDGTPDLYREKTLTPRVR